MLTVLAIAVGALAISVVVGTLIAPSRLPSIRQSRADDKL